MLKAIFNEKKKHLEFYPADAAAEYKAAVRKIGKQERLVLFCSKKELSKFILVNGIVSTNYKKKMQAEFEAEKELTLF